MRHLIRSLLPFAAAALVAACGDSGSGPVPVGAIEITAPADSVTVGQSIQLSATARSASGKELTGRPITWSSSDTTRIRVSAAGLVSAVAPGAATVTASSGGKSATRGVTAVPVRIASLSILPDPAEVEVGGTIQLAVVARDAAGNELAGRPITVVLSDTRFARLSETLVVTGVEIGSTTVTASAEGRTAQRTITVVRPRVASITVAPETSSLAVEETRQLTATLRDSRGNVLTDRAVVWSSSDAARVTVSPTGLASAVAPGTVTVTATSEGKSGTAAVTVPAGLFVRSLDAGGSTSGAQTCGLSATGVAYCWGLNSAGQLGDGTTVSRQAPRRVAGGLSFVSLSAGGDHTCGIATDGRAYCWGANFSGELGDGSRISRSTPVAVSTSLRFDSLAAGSFHTCGIATDGAAYCWGDNSSGQLGDGSTQASAQPVPVAAPSRFRSITAGSTHTCGVAMDGRGYCWGYNEGGELGNGSLDDRANPTPVAGGLVFQTISAGSTHTCGLDTTGKGYCWGRNSDGQLGDASNSHRTMPAAVFTTALRFASIRSDGRHTCALTGAGKAYCWGSNAAGALGEGSASGSNVPAEVSTPSTFSFLAVSGGGRGHSCGVAGTGQAFCWGANANGELGDGTLMDRRTPVPVEAQR